MSENESIEEMEPRYPGLTRETETVRPGVTLHRHDSSKKPSQLNPKDAVGVSKWRQYATVPRTVIAELGVAMLEGGRKYGRHNYRVAGVSASIYYDAAMGHLDQWWEGEDTDPDSGLSHVVKAIASLVVLRDAMIQDMLTDDRPPKANLDDVRERLQARVEDIIARHPDPVEPWTQARLDRDAMEESRTLVGTLRGPSSPPHRGSGGRK